MSKKSISHIYIPSRDGVDLNMYQCGIEECLPNHFFGPGLRDHFLIHYIIDGKGSFTINNKTYNLEKGDGFLIPPNVISHYIADKSNPWTYMWVGFHGLKAESYLKRANLTLNNPTFHTKEAMLSKYLYEMIEIDSISHYSDLKRQGLLFLFIAELTKSSSNSNTAKSEKMQIYYIQEAINYIENNYSRNIRISDIAKSLSLDRSYFSNLFKQYIQKSPQQFLLEYRMNKACELLKECSMSIKSIAISVGYLDQFSFSKAFKKYTGVSPSNYRQKITSLS